MKAEEFLSEFRKNTLEIVDNRSENLDFRFSRFFQHIGRLEALYLTNQISADRYKVLITEWKRHWPTTGREGR